MSYKFRLDPSDKDSKIRLLPGIMDGKQVWIRMSESALEKIGASFPAAAAPAPPPPPPRPKTPPMASEKQIRDILAEHLNLDIRETHVGDRRFTVTVKEGRAQNVCEWGELPEGHTMNDSRMWWIRKWDEDAGPPSDPAIAAAIEQALAFDENRHADPK